MKDNKPKSRHLRLYRKDGVWHVHDPHPLVKHILHTNDVPLGLADTLSAAVPYEFLRGTHKKVFISIPGGAPPRAATPRDPCLPPDLVA